MKPQPHWPHLTNTISPNQSLFHLRDKTSNIKYLVNTGASLSILPRKSFKQNTLIPDPSFQMMGANGSVIKTYGKANKRLNIGLGQQYSWSFIIADVTEPILGADFLRAKRILVDVTNKRLLRVSDLKSCQLIPTNQSHKVSFVPSRPASRWERLLCRFKPITCPQTCWNTETQHDVTHSIETTGRPCFSKARRLVILENGVSLTTFSTITF